MVGKVRDGDGRDGHKRSRAQRHPDCLATKSRDRFFSFLSLSAAPGFRYMQKFPQFNAKPRLLYIYVFFFSLQNYK